MNLAFYLNYSFKTTKGNNKYPVSSHNVESGEGRVRSKEVFLIDPRLNEKHPKQFGKNIKRESITKHSDLTTTK